MKWKINFNHKSISNAEYKKQKKHNLMTYPLPFKEMAYTKEYQLWVLVKASNNHRVIEGEFTLFFRGKYFGHNSLFLLSPSPYFFLVF